MEEVVLKVRRAGKVARIVQGPQVGIVRAGYNEIGVGVTREEKAQRHLPSVRPPIVIAGDQAQIIDRLYRRRTGSFIGIDNCEVGPVAEPNKSLGGAELADVVGVTSNIAVAVYTPRDSINI